MEILISLLQLIFKKENHYYLYYQPTQITFLLLFFILTLIIRNLHLYSIPILHTQLLIYMQLKFNNKPVTLNNNQLQSHNIQKLTLWDQLIMALIRPPRIKYRVQQLNQRGNSRDIRYRRQQIKIPHQNQHIQLSLFSPQEMQMTVTILYLHGNSSSRLQSLSFLNIIPPGYGLACFDFLGCGITQQQFISLGVRQSRQIQTVVQYCKRNFKSKIVLWGRSMGASSALKYGKCSIIVADSAFESLQKLCKQTSLEKKPQYICNCFVYCLFPCVFYKLKKDIRQKAQFDISDLNIKKSVKKIPKSTCIIFLSGNEDNLIKSQHSKHLYDTFEGKNKKLYLFEGNHNSKRPLNILKQVINDIQSALQQQMAQKVDEIIMTNQIVLNV